MMGDYETVLATQDCVFECCGNFDLFKYRIERERGKFRPFYEMGDPETADMLSRVFILHGSRAGDSWRIERAEWEKRLMAVLVVDLALAPERPFVVCSPCWNTTARRSTAELLIHLIRMAHDHPEIHAALLPQYV